MKPAVTAIPAGLFSDALDERLDGIDTLLRLREHIVVGRFDTQKYIAELTSMHRSSNSSSSASFTLRLR